MQFSPCKLMEITITILFRVKIDIRYDNIAIIISHKYLSWDIIIKYVQLLINAANMYSVSQKNHHPLCELSKRPANEMRVCGIVALVKLLVLFQIYV